MEGERETDRAIVRWMEGERGERDGDREREREGER